jgi:hypothetical protein
VPYLPLLSLYYLPGPAGGAELSPSPFRLGCLASRFLIFHSSASIIYLGLQEGLNSPPLLRLGCFVSRSLISHSSASVIPGPAGGAELSPSLEAEMLGL